MNNGSGVQIIDVREPWEFESGTLGNVNIPLAKLAEELPRLKAMGQALVLHCNTGPRSAAAQYYLWRNGIKQVKYLAGGLEAWQGKFTAYAGNTP